MKKNFIIVIVLILLLGCENKDSNNNSQNKSDNEAELACKDEEGNMVYSDFTGSCEEFFAKEKKEENLRETQDDVILDEYDDKGTCVLTLGVFINDEAKGYKLTEYKGKFNSKGIMDCEPKYPSIVSKSKEVDFSNNKNAFYYYYDTNKCDVFINNNKISGNTKKKCVELARKLYK